MKRYQQFLLFWLVNSAILFLANLFFPQAVTLGNSILAMYQAVILSGFYWSLIIWYLEPVLKDMQVPQKDNTSMMLAYLSVNFATVWLLARMSFLTGVGIASFVYALGIAVVANFAQYMVWQYTQKKGK
ncbi:MAG: hypothetical protein UT24_C0001G0079 [Candidatus Woesebacteria bacterium GW2011_GWB1_39_12]|uniref:Uncharacterized protein n=2 Tax=Candidatus Woeseibacteriota TaxID=1752722 RepID=A0A0G0M3N2_9BACT|nr:MAG: hypothetical protein UT23_C0001G0079 [Candidatus Woesebacteria bacterium GW2011_GWA1_39_12]KKR01919.1 MAG: hypothetical protein UT24_C0001G0079 [Candidatus Woesebacteria bacterium GW2011_GWB1_39_12]